MTFNGFVTFFIDFVGVRFLFKNSFHSFLKHSKKYDFMTLNSPAHEEN